MTAATLLQEAETALQAAGVTSPAWDAERLLRHVLDWDRATLISRPETEIADSAAACLRALVVHRARRVPLQHLVGVQAFWKHDFLVSPDVLVPRPETELLVETALARLRNLPRPVVVDVGTGSGCIALSLAAERPDAEIHAGDLSEPALTVARENARRLGLESRVRFHLGHLLDPFVHLAGRIDLVLSNPPYVPPSERDTLAPEVRDHEPALALFPPEEGPGIYAQIARGSKALLRPEGLLAVEIGLGQQDPVRCAIESEGLWVTDALPDLQGITRVIVAVRPRC